MVFIRLQQPELERCEARLRKKKQYNRKDIDIITGMERTRNARQ
jgi:hypothetical protein